MEFSKIINDTEYQIKINEDLYSAEVWKGDHKVGRAEVSYSNYYPVKINNLALIGETRDFFSQLLGKKVGGFFVPDATVSAITERVETVINQFKDDFKAGKIKIVLEQLGCRVYDVTRTDPHWSFTLDPLILEKRGPLSVSEKISNALGFEIWNSPFKYLKDKPSYYADHGTKFDVTNDLLSALEKGEKRAQKNLEHWEKLERQAKETGESVLTGEWDEFDNRENCVVNCREYVLPDGKTKVERVLTY